jgi:CubicO group peptidase (beta-lactamase class C family)
VSNTLTTEGIERFADVAARHLGDGSVPGLVALMAHRDRVHVEALGTLSRGGPAVRRDSLFRIASTIKPVTGAATLALVRDGLIGLDEPVGRRLPELAHPRVLRRMDGPLNDTVPVRRDITVPDLLTFTFGFGMLADMFAAPTPWPVVTAASELQLATLGAPMPDEQPDPDTWIASLGALPLLDQPGERWLYNTAASVLGVLIARVAGMPLGDVLRARIFEPLGMTQTAFWTDDPSRLATASLPSDEGLVVWDAPDGQWSRPPAFGDGGAGLVSTGDDLLAFARMVLKTGGSLLPPDALREMTRDQLTTTQRRRDRRMFLNGRGWGFCQAVIVEGPRAGAFGWDGGLGTSWLVDPVRDVTVIVLTQRMFTSPTAPRVHTELQVAAYAALR